MKIYLLLMIALIMFVSICIIHDNIGTAQIYVEKPIINVGNAEQYFDPGENQVYFTITNVGKQPLELHRIIAGCPCLEPQIDKNILAAGESAKLSVNVYYPELTGTFSEKLNILSNDPDNPIQDLTIMGYVKKPILAVPSSIKIENLKRDIPQLFELKVYGPGDVPDFDITDIQSANKYIPVEYSKKELLGNNQRVEITILLKINSLSKERWSDDIIIHTNNSENSKIVIPVTVQETTLVTVTPRLLMFSRKDYQEKTAKEIILKTNYDDKLSVHHIQTSKQLIFEVNQNKPGEICVSVLLSQNLDQFIKEDMVIIMDDNTPIKVPVWLMNN